MSTSTTEHPAAVSMREVPEAVARGDFPAVLEKFPEDVIWYAPAGERVYRGHDGLAQFFAHLDERSDGTWRPEVEEVLGSDRHVVVFLRITAERDDDRLDVLVAHFATVGPGGFTRNWFLPSDLGAWKRFFG